MLGKFARIVASSYSVPALVLPFEFPAIIFFEAAVRCRTDVQSVQYVKTRFVRSNYWKNGKKEAGKVNNISDKSDEYNWLTSQYRQICLQSTSLQIKNVRCKGSTIDENLDRTSMNFDLRSEYCHWLRWQRRTTEKRTVQVFLLLQQRRNPQFLGSLGIKQQSSISTSCIQWTLIKK